MIIGIDGNEANTGKKVGIGEYAFQTIVQFYLLREKSISNSRFLIYLKDTPRNDLPKPTDWWNYRIVGPKKLWTQLCLPFHLYIDHPRPDVFFSPSHYAPRFSPVPSAIAIMDMSFLRFPQYFAKHDLYQLTSWTKYSVRKAKRIFTISESSKNDIIKAYHITPAHVIVTYPGIKQILQKSKSLNMSNLQKRFGISENFILFVGTLQPRKNITRLIEAFSKIKKDNVQLVVVGKKGWLFEDIFTAPEKYGIKEKVKFLDFVSDEDLPSLYQNALCYILPSLYEGFGLPVLEAMQYGCPVITSNVSSLPEAGGAAAVYVNPEDVNDIAEKIEKVITDEKLRKQMIIKGYEQIKKFSWERSAKETLAILEQLGGKREG